MANNEGDDHNGELLHPNRDGKLKALSNLISNNLAATVIGGLLLIGIVHLWSMPNRVEALEAALKSQTSALVDIKNDLKDIKNDQRADRNEVRADIRVVRSDIQTLTGAIPKSK